MSDFEFPNNPGLSLTSFAEQPTPGTPTPTPGKPTQICQIKWTKPIRFERMQINFFSDNFTLPSSC